MLAVVKRIRLRIRGLVQGVFYRASTSTQAKRLGLDGWVRNRSDGSVEVVAQGNEKVLAELTTWCRRGPEGARVSSVEVTDEPMIEPLSGFHVTP